MIRSRQSRGFTLIEMMVSIGLFAVMTVGVVPLLASSIKGSTLSRSYTVGKNLAVESMERIRGLPYNVAIGAQPTNDGINKTKVDVLDLYFPCATSTGCGGPGTSYAAGVFTTVCSVGSSTPACPRAIPEGYTVSYFASFVQPSTSTPETYTPLTALTSPPLPTGINGYDWKSTSRDRAPSKLLKILVSVSWEIGEDPQSYDLETLKSERKFGSEKIVGTGQVDHAVKVVTTFNEGLGQPSTLAATGARSSSSISLRLAALGSEVARAGEITLVREGTLTEPAQALATPPPTGATSSVQAPPDQAPAGTSTTASALTHPDFCQDRSLSPALLPACQRSQVGYLAATETSGLSVGASNEVPAAAGTATMNPSIASSFDMFVNGQRNASDSKNPLRLINEPSYNSGSTVGAPVFSIRPTATGVATNADCSPSAALVACRSMFATTSATTGALGAANRRVETTARTGFAEARFFPVDFIPGSASSSKAVLRLSNFTASTRCVATGSSATSSATAAWSADLDYYSETRPNDGETKGSYLPADAKLKVNSTNFASVIGLLKSTNPMIYEVPDNPAAIPPVTGPQDDDIYLFPRAGVLKAHPSYLIDLAGATVTTQVGSDGRTASALITSALSLTTGPTDPDRIETSLVVSLGALSCSAADRR